ncbi:serine hydrolase domain-containing protein [Granulicoccus phenolivorans]|uniref:serine hydrolase domain-containing protein n=1 Tax=Granulicoccus phenolivorans TaxID=266854 RepID=UPI00047DD9F3|nr:serine hydrolase domain-containing protein [Granulicoccus phenolivorans]
MSLDGRLDSYLPELAGTEAGGVTLLELATHTSGLPELAKPIDAALLAQSLSGQALGIYTEAESAAVIEQTRRVSLTGRGEWAYSNLGMSLLGFALARAANAPDWTTLVTQRLLLPLG